VAGLLVHAVYLGGVFVGTSLGVEPGISALIVGLQPLLTSAVAGMLLGERVAPRQWAGSAPGCSSVAPVARADGPRLARGSWPVDTPAHP
jgi:drug/metabolite transporter (DMT)-like permease